MNVSPEISVVVPVFNRAKVVERTLDSIAAQTLRPLDLILVDTASTDDSQAVLRTWAARNESEGLRIRILHEKRQGAAAARSRGLSEVTTPYVYFFDSDDYLFPDTLSRFVEAFRSNPQAQIVCGAVVLENMNREEHTSAPPHRSLIINHFHHSFLRTIAYASRTDFLREIGGWDTNLRIWDDWELGLRILLATPEIVRLPGVVAHNLRTHDSVTGDLYSHRERFYEPVLKRVEALLCASNHPDRRLLLRLVQGRRMMLAALYAREGRKDLSAPLRRRVLALTKRDRWLRLILRGAYHYRRLGLRGTDRITTLLLGKI